MVAVSLGLSLFIFIASNFADPFSFFLREPHFKSLSRCDTALESFFFSKTTASYLTLLFRLSSTSPPPFPCLHGELLQVCFDDLALDVGTQDSQDSVTIAPNLKLFGDHGKDNECVGLYSRPYP